MGLIGARAGMARVEPKDRDIAFAAGAEPHAQRDSEQHRANLSHANVSGARFI